MRVNMVVYECTNSALRSLLKLLEYGNSNTESPTRNFNKICRIQKKFIYDLTQTKLY